MKIRSFILLFLSVSLVLISCASVQVDYDPEFNFSQYKTYNYYPEMESGISQLDNKRVQAALDSLLPLKGLTKSDTPDVFINYYAAESINDSRSTIGLGVGGGGANGGVGVSGGIPIGRPKIQQQFTLDFVDPMKDALIWQGITLGNFPENAKPEKRKKYYLKVVERILNKYPPKK